VRITSNGKQHNKTFSSKEEARIYALEAEASLGKQTFVADERITLGEVLRRYVEEVTPQKRGAAEETDRIRHLLHPDNPAHSLTKLSLCKLTPPAVAQWRDTRRKQVAAATVGREWSILQHALEVARREWGYNLPNNPFRSVKRPEIRNSRTRRVEQSEIDAIVSASESAELAGLVALAVETAARRGELLALRWEEVSLPKQVATLRVTKNGEVRQLPLSSRAVATLQRIPQRLDGGAVFTLRPDSVSQAFRRAVERARMAYEEETPPAQQDRQHLIDLKFHDLRHEACSRLAERGLSTTELAAVSGHKTLQLVARYTHHRPELLAKKLG
jgi:integrase